MAGVTVKINNTTLPGEITALKRGDELLWSEGTGRSASSGLMVGSVVAKKQTYTVSWGILTAAQYDVIKNAVVGGFFNLVITVSGTTVCNISAYRGTITGELLSTVGSAAYWKGVQVELVER